MGADRHGHSAHDGLRPVARKRRACPRLARRRTQAASAISSTGRFTKPRRPVRRLQSGDRRAHRRRVAGLAGRRRRRGRRGAQGAAELVGALAATSARAISTRSRATCRSASAFSRCWRRSTTASRSANRATSTFPWSPATSTITPAGRRWSPSEFPGPRAGRRLRADHPVEFPAADARLEDRAGARGRQHGRAEARRVHAADRARLRRDLRRGGLAAGRRQHRHRRRRDRRGARRACRRRQDRLHRLDRGRPRHPQGDGRNGQEAVARTRRQVAVHRLRRRRSRQRGRGRRRRDLVQPGAGLLRRLAAARRRRRSPTASRQDARAHGQAPGRRSARQVDRHRRDRRAGPARAHRAAGARRRERRAATVWRADDALPERGCFYPPTLRHRRRARLDARARRNLRPGAGGHDLPHAGRGGRARQQHALRPRRLGVDGEHQPRARSRGARSRPASSGSTRPTCSTPPPASAAIAKAASAARAGARASPNIVAADAPRRKADAARRPRFAGAARAAGPAPSGAEAIDRTAKLYIGGKQARPDSGY